MFFLVFTFCGWVLLMAPPTLERCPYDEPSSPDPSQGGIPPPWRPTSTARGTDGGIGHGQLDAPRMGLPREWADASASPWKTAGPWTRAVSGPGSKPGGSRD